MTATANDWVLDKKYGRQGGRRTKHETVETRVCDVCGGGMVLGQPGRHWSCSPTCTGCHRPTGPTGQNCHCGGRRR